MSRPKPARKPQDGPRRVGAPRAKPPVPLERDVQRAVVATLQAFGCVVHRRNTGAMTATYKGKSRFVRYSEKGAADLWAVAPVTGAHWEIEVKRPGGRPTPDQMNWLLAHNGIGKAAAFWVDNVGTLDRVVRCLLGGGRVVYWNASGDFYLVGE